jgi:uncharacterized protein
MVFWMALVTGFLGSAHCVGMCGGLVTAAAPTKLANFFYQLGRLFSYSMLGFVGGWVGMMVSFRASSPWIGVLPALTLGVAFIWIGLNQISDKTPRLPFPSFLQRISHKGMAFALTKKYPGEIKGFAVGFLSFLLPCGFLYGAVLVSLSFQNPLISLGVMVFFWLGTTPAMSFAPELLKRVLKPLQARSPLMLSLFFICLGVGTIAWKLYHHTPAGGASCH